MPSPQEIAQIGAITEAGLARVSPQLAEKLSRELPHLLNEWGTALVRRLPQSDALPLMQIGEEFQASLQHFKLAPDSSLSDLMTAARKDGLAIKDSTYHGYRSAGAAKKVILPNGDFLTSSARSDRHSSRVTLEFSNPNLADTRLATFFENSSLSGRSTVWSFESPTFEHSLKVRGY